MSDNSSIANSLDEVAMGYFATIIGHVYDYLYRS